MYKILLTIIVLVFFTAVLVSAERIELGTISEDVNVVVEESNAERTVVRFEIGAFYKEAVDINGSAFNIINCGREAVMLEKGLPALPRVCRSIIIPDDARVSIRILSANYIDFPETPIAPSKGNLLRTVNPEDIPYTFGAVYNIPEWYPKELALVREPYILRDYRGTVIEFSAFQYHPVKQILRVYTSVTVEVVSEGQGEINVLKNRQNADKLVPDFDLIYKRRFINYNIAQKYTPVMESGDMLVITYDAFHTAMDPFVEWKKQKGIKTTIVDVSTIGNSSSSISSYIQDFYDSTNLVWVLLVGDHVQVATPYASGGASDPSYAKVAGGDNYPDIIIGRFSAESISQTVTQVERTLTYEQAPPGTVWFHRGTGIASNQGPGHYGEYDNEHMDLIRNDLLSFTYTQVDQFYDPSATASQVTSALNSGRSVINYCGHGSTTSWGTTGYSNSHVNALTNDNLLPFIISVACINGEFDGPTCFAEAWLRATNNGVPTGAVGAYMSSINQSWSPPMYAQDEAVDLLVAGEKTTFGGICYNGSCFMIDVVGSGGVDMYNTWHIFGDPSVLLRTDEPVLLTVNHETVMLFNISEFSLEVVGEEGALCAIYHNGILYGSAYTGADGLATITFNEPLPLGESVTLTVTAFNALPYTSTIQVITPSGPYVIYDFSTIDDAAGNGNGLVDNGESIVLGMQLVNVGPDDALNVNATISTTDSYVTITDNTEAYGTITADWGTGYVIDAFAFDVASDAPDDHRITFDLVVTGTARDTWTGSFQIPIHAPVVSFISLSVNDANGNNNGVLDPGETTELVLTLSNSGTGQAFDVEAYISASDQYFVINDNYGTFGTLDSINGSGNNSLDVYEVSADADCPLGYAVPIMLDISAGGGYAAVLYFNVTVGDRVEFYIDDFSFDQGWSGLGGSAEWMIASAVGGGGDPSQDHTPTTDNFLLGNDLTTSGTYNNGIGSTQWITSPIIDCGSMSGIIMTYYHWLGIESNNYDHAYLQVYDGSSWVTMFENGSSTIQETSWIMEEYDLSSYADSNPDFQIRFGLGATDGSVSYCGWNIDDIVIKGYGTIGYPSLNITPLALSDSLQPGDQVQKTVRIKNNGAGTLRVWLSATESWLEVTGEQQVIAPGDSVDVIVTMNTSGLSCGDHNCTLDYTSNDNDNSSGSLPVFLHIYTPDIEIVETSIDEILQNGSQTTHPMVIFNNGAGRLYYQVGCQMFQKSGGGVRSASSTVLGEPLGYRPAGSDKPDAAEPYFAPLKAGFGGPDTYGHFWTDSDEPGGPLYYWVNISGSGTEVTLGDDDYAGPFPLGFSFPFYDSVYTEFYIGSNGYITFDEGSNRRFNSVLPDASMPALVSMWWDDLDPRKGGHVYYYNDTAYSRLVVSFVDIRFYHSPDGTGSVTFQAILYPDGTIKYQYGSMIAGQHTLESATVGIQNSEADDALLILYNAAYMHDNLAIDITSEHWLSASPSGGMIEPFANASVDILLDATDLTDGQFSGMVVVASNDPDTPSWSVPVSLLVASWLCGDIDGNGTGPDIADLVYFVEYSFSEPPGPPPPVMAAADVDSSGEVDVADMVYLVEYMFGQPPGPDPTCPQ